MSVGDYWLGEHELEETFQRHILPVLEEPFGPPPASDPRLVIFAGQPGSRIVHEALKLDADWGLDMMRIAELDTFRAYHPQISDLLDMRVRGVPGVDMVLDSAAWWWQQRSFAHARSGGYHVYLPSTPDPTQLDQLADQFANSDAGYQVRLVVAAVPAAMSRLGVLERYTMARSHGGAGRLPDHDGPFSEIPQLCQAAQAHPSVHRISVATRDGIVHDRHRGPDGAWDLTGPAVADVVTVARVPSFTPIQRAALATRLAEVTDRLASLGPIPEDAHDLQARVLGDLNPAHAKLAEAMQDIANAQAALDGEPSTRWGPGLDPGPQRGPGTGPEPHEP